MTVASAARLNGLRCWAVVKRSSEPREIEYDLQLIFPRPVALLRMLPGRAVRVLNACYHNLLSKGHRIFLAKHSGADCLHRWYEVQYADFFALARLDGLLASELVTGHLLTRVRVKENVVPINKPNGLRASSRRSRACPVPPCFRRCALAEFASRFRPARA